MRILFITGNQNKLAEARAILEPEIEVASRDIDLPEIQSLDPEAVLRAKLVEARKHISDPCFVEDTSLFFDAWNGLPGPLIKWFLQARGNQGLWEMLASETKNREAEARTVIGYVDHEGRMSFFSGSTRGYIVGPSTLSNSFGWDPIFVPYAYDARRTFADMTAPEKNAISMRRKALEGLRAHLEQHRSRTQGEP